MGAINWLKPSNRKPFGPDGGLFRYSYYRPAADVAGQLKRHGVSVCKAFGTCYSCYTYFILLKSKHTYINRERDSIKVATSRVAE